VRTIRQAPRVFLCGPISRACEGGEFDPAVRQVMESFASTLEAAGFVILSAHREEGFGQAIPDDPVHVFERDLSLASRCSVMVAVVPNDKDGRPYRTDGTFIELGWATALEKPLVVVTDCAAPGHSYLFAGLLGSGCVKRVVTLSDAVREPSVLLHAVRDAVCPKAQGGLPMSIGFCCTSFGFGPVSKVVAVAEALRQLRPEYRLRFAGSNIANTFASDSGVFDEVVDVDLDASPEDGLECFADDHAVVNGLNFELLDHWHPGMPPVFFLDSLAWMWQAVPSVLARAHTYCVQDYLLGASLTERVFPENTSLVPPIVSPGVGSARDPGGVEHGYLLASVAGCRNPILPPDFYRDYVRVTVAAVASAVERIRRKGTLAIKRVLICGNPDLVRDASSCLPPSGSLEVRCEYLPHPSFLGELRKCEVLLTSPGLTGTLEALALNVPCKFLLPQNYSQLRIIAHYQALGLDTAAWTGAFDTARLTQVGMPEEEAVREIGTALERYLAGGSEAMSRAVEASLVSTPVGTETEALRDGIAKWDGSYQVAQHVIGFVEGPVQGINQ